MQKYSIFIILWLIIITACQKENNDNQPTINGIWKSVGSGWVLQIKDSTNYAFYDQTSISCLPNRKGDLNEIISSLSLKQDTLSLLKGVINYKFTSLNKLPVSCIERLDVQKEKDVIYNFEVFAETVREHYAFFELNNINWNTLYTQQKNKLNKNSKEVELYAVIEETLEKLKDNHAYLEATEEVETAVEQLDKLEDKEDQIREGEELPEYGDFQVAKLVAKHHMKEELTKDSWLIQWGKLNDSIGYIQVKAMWLYADLNISKTLIDKVGYVDAYVKTFHQMYEGVYINKEVLGVHKIMNNVMNDLSEMASIVIDVRFNGGGQDAVSFEILNRFIPDQLQIATQKLRYGTQFTPMWPLNIQGTKNAYTKPVYVLTSTQIGSAAEAFSIATLAMDNVKRIGSNTSGAMSTALEKTLPNGWAFSISNEIYMDNSGKNYENIGIPPDYRLNYSTDRQTFFRSIVNDLEKDKMQILKGIETLKKLRKRNTFYIVK
ncbi:S41 family peptidase [Aquimarina rhabdastrellae]